MFDNPHFLWAAASFNNHTMSEDDAKKGDFSMMIGQLAFCATKVRQSIHQHDGIMYINSNFSFKLTVGEEATQP